MTDYSTITQVKISGSEEETNELLSNDWILMGVFNQIGRPVFVLGLPYTFDLKTFCDTVKSLSKSLSEAV